MPAAGQRLETTRPKRAYRNDDISGTPPEETFDRLARVAAELMDAPVALVSLIDRDRRWFKAHVGTNAESGPKDWGFCAHTLRQGRPLVVLDAGRDDRFAGDPLVVGDPRIRFFAGVSLVARDGTPMGTLCVIDRVARPAPTEGRLNRLRDVAALVVDELERRRAAQSAPDDTLLSQSRLSQRVLRQSLEFRGTFLVSLSHALRTPLNTVIGMSELIAASESADTKGFAEEILAAGWRILELIDDIIEHQRVDSAGRDLAPVPLRLRPVVADAARMVSTFAHARGIRITTHYEWEDASVNGDPRSLKHILLHLLTNALRGTPPAGEVTVTVSGEGSGRVCVEVADTGPGMNPMDLACAMTPFGDPVPSSGPGPVVHGTGFGLPRAKALVEQHGGELEIRTEAGRGTRALIYLDALQPIPGQPEPSS